MQRRQETGNLAGRERLSAAESVDDSPTGEPGRRFESNRERLTGSASRASREPPSATAGERASAAGRVAWCANDRAEVHQGKVVVTSVRCGEELLRENVNFDGSRFASKLESREQPHEDTSNVGVRHRRREITRERKHRVRRVRSNPRECEQAGKRERKPACVALDHLAREAMEAERSPVIPKPSPRLDDLSRRGACQRLERRPSLQPPEKVRNHPRDLRLLQHHLGDEDGVRVARQPPWEVMAAVHRVPAPKGVSEFRELAGARGFAGSATRRSRRPLRPLPRPARRSKARARSRGLPCPSLAAARPSVTRRAP